MTTTEDRELWVPGPPDTFAKRLLWTRLELGLTQEELAVKIDVKASTYATWENGVRPSKIGTGEIAMRLENEFGVNRSWVLYGDSDQGKRHPRWNDIEPARGVGWLQNQRDAA